MPVGRPGLARGVWNLNGISSWRRQRHGHESAATVHRVFSSPEPREFIHEMSLVSVVETGKNRDFNFETVGGLG